DRRASGRAAQEAVGGPPFPPIRKAQQAGIRCRPDRVLDDEGVVAGAVLCDTVAEDADAAQNLVAVEQPDVVDAVPRAGVAAQSFPAREQFGLLELEVLHRHGRKSGHELSFGSDLPSAGQIRACPRPRVPGSLDPPGAPVAPDPNLVYANSRTFCSVITVQYSLPRGLCKGYGLRPRPIGWRRLGWL